MPDPVGLAELYLILVPFIACVSSAQIKDASDVVSFKIIFKLSVAWLVAPVRLSGRNRMKIPVSKYRPKIPGRNQKNDKYGKKDPPSLFRSLSYLHTPF